MEFPRFVGQIFLKRRNSVTMPRTRPAYPPEYREQIVALARSGRSVEDLAREFESCAHTIYAWVRQADEPPRVYRRLFSLSHATLAHSVDCA